MFKDETRSFFFLENPSVFRVKPSISFAYCKVVSFYEGSVDMTTYRRVRNCPHCRILFPKNDLCADSYNPMI